MYPNVEAERARKGMTREQLATAIGVDRKTLRKWMTTGKIPPKGMEKLVEVLGATADYLFGR